MELCISVARNRFSRIKIDSEEDANSKELFRLSQILLKLTRNELIDSVELTEALKFITEAAADGLNTERASVWIFNEERNAIVCLDLFERSKNTHSAGFELRANDYPAYFKYLQEERTLPAHNAHTDTATSEFSAAYLKPLGINSMLDAPFRKNGAMVGVICCEHVGDFRRWTAHDEIFAGSIADMISKVIVTADRRRAVFDLEQMNANLEKIVLIRNQELDVQRSATIQAAKLSSLGEMSAGIAHEINTPLATIQLLAGQLSAMAEVNNLNHATVAEVSNKIESTVSRIAKIVTSLRLFSRDTANDSFKSVSVSSVVEDTLSFCNQKLRYAGIDLKIDPISSDLKCECRAIQIQQILLNLIGNSLDAISHLDIKWIQISAKSAGENIEILVTDSGTGIAQELHQKIMLPFFTTKGIGKGTGLGLSVSMGIAQSHRGLLSLVNESANTQFKLVIPKEQKI